MRYNLFFLLIIPFILFFITGCVNYEEETWLQPDGSGKIKMKISINAEMAEMSSGNDSRNTFSAAGIKKSLSKVKGIKLLEAGEYVENSEKNIFAIYEFSSPEHLKNIPKDENSPDFLGQFTLQQTDNGTVTFTRFLGKLNSSESSASGTKGTKNKQEEMSKQFLSSMLEDYKWKYTIHFPYRVTKANTDKKLIDYKTNTVTWEIPLSSMEKNQILSATLSPSGKIPFEFSLAAFLENIKTMEPRMMAMIGGGVLVLIILLVVLSKINGKTTIYIDNSMVFGGGNGGDAAAAPAMPVDGNQNIDPAAMPPPKS